MRRQTDAYVDDDFMVPDGGSVKVRMALMDSVQRRVAFDAANHQPGYRSVSDAAVRAAQDARNSARARWIREMGDAWRSPQKRAVDKNPGGGLTCPRCHGAGKIDGRECPRCDGEGFVEDYPAGYEHEPKDARSRAYFQMVQRLQDAWKDAAQPDQSSSNAEWRRHLRNVPDPGDPNAMMRRHLRTEPDDDAQARRDRAYADYCARVSQAWKQNNPAARANSVERQRRQWTGEAER
jgi:hypothetical protein